jgi:hypothetical protein
MQTTFNKKRKQYIYLKLHQIIARLSLPFLLILGSQLVGPYTSTMGVMSKMMDGLKNLKKLFTSLVGTMFYKTCLLVFLKKSIVCLIRITFKKEKFGTIPVIPIINFWLARVM